MSEISYAIAEDSRRRGYGHEAVVAACSWGAPAFGLTKIVALTWSANLVSRRMLVRAGFSDSVEVTQRFQGVDQAVCLYTWRLLDAP